MTNTELRSTVIEINHNNLYSTKRTLKICKVLTQIINPILMFLVELLCLTKSLTSLIARYEGNGNLYMQYAHKLMS